MKRAVAGGILLIFSLVIGWVLAEVLAVLYVTHIKRQGKLFEPDVVLGWQTLPNLDLERLNSNGERWRIQTNAQGYRTDAHWRNDAARRVLIVGDSFVFGEGVNQEDRFDTLLAIEQPEWSILNLGTMGFGADQAVLSAQPYLPDLRPGDRLILFTYFNDYVDILRQQFAGRSKPWFSFEHGILQHHAPQIGLVERLRDRSYLISTIVTKLEGDLYAYSRADVENGLALYQALVLQETFSARQSGIHVLIVYHGERLLYQSNQLTPERFEEMTQAICANEKITCLFLDQNLPSPPDDAVFLKDGHWNQQGHRRVADVLIRYFNHQPHDK